jgi:hypothetical protein
MLDSFFVTAELKTCGEDVFRTWTLLDAMMHSFFVVPELETCGMRY